MTDGPRPASGAGASAASAAATGARPERDRFPSGIPFIVGNEAAERFSYYGMRAILYLYVVGLYLKFAQESTVPAADLAAARAQATQVTHLFFAGVYLFPLIGAVLADRLLGKYRVIFWVSLIYCAGHAALAIAGREGRLGRFGAAEMGLYLGLGLIAFGSGGIKPCVSANVGDQFGEDKAHLVTKVFQIFYFSINFGSFFSQIITPALYVGVGPEVAFGVPGILMVVAAVVFWAGRNRFVRVPAQPGGVLGLLDAVVTICLLSPFFALIVGYFVLWEHFVPPPGAAGLAAFGAFLGSYPWLPLGTLAALGAGVALFVVRQRIQPDTTSFLPVLVWSVRNRRLRRPGQSLFDPARERFGEEAGDGPPAVLRIMLVFSAVSVFWALFDQHASTWVEQAKQMDLTLSIPGRSEPVRMNPAQVAALNPIMVMILIPALNLLVYAPLRRRGVEVKPLVRMAAGMFIAALAFVAAAALQGVIERVGTGQIHAVWQVGQYLFLTVAEVLVSITGLEFAYTQAPRAMKSTIMGFWLACIAMGNILVAFLAPLQKRLPLSQFFWLFAGLMLVAAVLFSILARFYRGKTYLQRA